MSFWQLILACVRVIVLFAIIGGIGYVIYDNVRANKGGDAKSAMPPTPSLPNVGDTVTMNSNVVGCPIPDDLAKVRELLRTNSDRQPAASYAVEHRCMVLAKSKSFKVEAQSAQRRTACLRVPGQSQCLWTPAEAFDVSGR
jgi:hypothetical protein